MGNRAFSGQNQMQKTTVLFLLILIIIIIPNLIIQALNGRYIRSDIVSPGKKKKMFVNKAKRYCFESFQSELRSRSKSNFIE